MRRTRHILPKFDSPEPPYSPPPGYPGPSPNPRTTQTALASWPRSGALYLAMLLHHSGLVRVGSIYPDDPVSHLAGTAPGEGDVIKTHFTGWRAWQRAIHLVRNPYDAIPSYYHQVRERYPDLEWREHVTRCLEGRGWLAAWQDHIAAWSAAEIPTLRVLYEDMVEDPDRELRRVLEWLGKEPREDDISNAVDMSSFDKMHDVYPAWGPVGAGRAAFSFEQAAAVSEVCGTWLTALWL